MNILILGGTRFLGKKVVNGLMELGHKVTVISRNQESTLESVQYIRKDRSLGIKELAGQSFEIVIDFIAFNESDVKEIMQSDIKVKKYFFISTVWISKINRNILVNEPVKNLSENDLAHLPVVTQKYLQGKVEAENLMINNSLTCDYAISLRLPILWGHDEHTGRVEFFRNRILDEYKTILIDGGENTVQIGYVEDVARVLISFVLMDSEYSQPIYEALPLKSFTLKQLLQEATTSLRKVESFVEIASNKLKEQFQEYLEIEPLWREKYIPLSSSNLFKICEIGCSENWIQETFRLMDNKRMIRSEKEINFLEAYQKG